MNNKISLWISGNIRRSGYGPILQVNEPVFSCPEYDGRPGMKSVPYYIIIKLTREYSQYTLVLNNITTSDGYPNALLKFSIGIPANFMIGEKNVYEVLMEIKQLYTSKYMVPTYGMDGYTFKDVEVEKQDFVAILDKYSLKPCNYNYKAMGGNSSVSIHTEDIALFISDVFARKDLSTVGEYVIALGNDSHDNNTIPSQTSLNKRNSADFKKPRIDITPQPTPNRVILPLVIFTLMCVSFFAGYHSFKWFNNPQSYAIRSDSDTVKTLLTTHHEQKQESDKYVYYHKLLDNEDLTFEQVYSMFKKAKEENLQQGNKQLFDTIDAYKEAADRIRNKLFGNRRGLRDIVGISGENTDSLKDGEYIFGINKFKTKLDGEMYKLLKPKHKKYLVQVFIGKYKGNEIKAYNPEEREKNYKRACDDYFKWKKFSDMEKKQE